MHLKSGKKVSLPRSKSHYSLRSTTAGTVISGKGEDTSLCSDLVGKIGREMKSEDNPPKRRRMGKTPPSPVSTSYFACAENVFLSFSTCLENRSYKIILRTINTIIYVKKKNHTCSDPRQICLSIIL